MLARNKVYKHSNCIDVAFHVNNINSVDSSNVSVTGTWMTITAMGKLHATASDTVSIKINDIKEWHLYGDQE